MKNVRNCYSRMKIGVYVCFELTNLIYGMYDKWVWGRFTWPRRTILVIWYF